MTTKNLVPRETDEGQIGTVDKKWDKAIFVSGSFETLEVGGQQISGGGGSPDYISEGQAKVETIDTGTDARIEFYVDTNDDGNSDKVWEITELGHLLPGINDTFDIGNPSYKVRDLYVSDNSLWLGDDHKLSIRAGKISHKKRKKSSGYQPKAFLGSNLNRGSFDRDKLLAIKKTSNGGDGTGTGAGGSASDETELTLSDWVRYANATQIDGVNVSNRFRSNKSGGPQEGKWTANDIFDEDDDFEEIIDPSSATNLDLTSFSNDAKATTIDDSSPSATKFVTESAVTAHVNTKISAISLSLNNLSDVDTSGVSSGQVLKWDGSNWTPAADNSGGSGSGGSRPTISVVTNSSSNWASNVFTVPDAASTSVLEIVYLVNLSQSTTQSIKLPDATLAVNDGFKIQIKRIGTDPVNIITHSNTQKIDNVANASISLPHQYSSLTLMCNQSTADGAQGWWIV